MIANSRLVDPVLDSGGFLHGFTSAGNPLSCAAGLAVLEELETQNIIENAAAMGDELRVRLDALMQQFPFIGDVRGKGLLLAFELVADRETMTPLPRELNAYAHLVEEAYERGLIIYSRRTRGGTEGDHFMICPPLIVTSEQLDELMELLTRSLIAFARAVKLPFSEAQI